MSDKQYRDPTEGFEVGDLIYDCFNDCEYELSDINFTETVKELLLENGLKLLEFTCPVMGRLRVLTEGEPTQMLGKSALYWSNLSKSYQKVYNNSDLKQGVNSNQYYMPADQYHKWKAEQYKTKRRFEVKYGKFGAYFFDNENSCDMTLEDVEIELNLFSSPEQLIQKGRDEVMNGKIKSTHQRSFQNGRLVGKAEAVELSEDEWEILKNCLTSLCIHNNKYREICRNIVAQLLKNREAGK